MARRMLSLAALLSPRRWRSAPAVRCLQNSCNQLRVTYMSTLRSLGRAVQGQAELATCKALAITASAICWPTKALERDSSLDCIVRTAYKSCGAKSSGLRSRDFTTKEIQPHVTSAISPASMRFASVLIIASVRAFAPTPSPRHSHKLVLRAEDEPNAVTKGAWFAAELAGKAKAALGGAPEKGPTTEPPRSVSEAVDRIKLDYEGPEGPYFLTGKMDAGCCQ